MAGHRFYLRLIAAALPLSLLSPVPTLAQEPPGAPPPSVPLPDEPRPPGDAPRKPPHERDNEDDRPDGENKEGKGRKFRAPPDGEGFRENTKKMLENMTPDQRQEFWRNFQRWVRMKPEMKDELLHRDKERRKKIREEMEQVIKEIGIPENDETRRKQFFQRYFKERKAIEEELRKEMDEKRQPQLQELKEKLKAEFSKPASSEEKMPKSSSDQPEVKSKTETL